MSIHHNAEHSLVVTWQLFVFFLIIMLLSPSIAFFIFFPVQRCFLATFVFMLVDRTVTSPTPCTHTRARRFLLLSPLLSLFSLFASVLPLAVLFSTVFPLLICAVSIALVFLLFSFCWARFTSLFLSLAWHVSVFCEMNEWMDFWSFKWNVDESFFALEQMKWMDLWRWTYEWMNTENEKHSARGN